MAPRSGWNVETLKEHVDERFDAMQELMETRFTAQDKALEIAAGLAVTVKKEQNEWRGTVNDVMQHMIPRSEYAVQHQALVDVLAAQEKRLNVASGERAGEGSTKGQTFQIVMAAATSLATICAVVAIILAILLH